jgi:dynein heavy chain
MNPGYAGRSELPDNLKSLFRPISMMVPESTMICEIMLSSEGFKYGKTISNKIVVLYQLMSQQLSKQDHYDFGLRAIKSVLTCAGAIRRDANIESPLDKVDKKDKELIKELEEQELGQEILILMRAINDMNIPKFVGEDIPLFNSLFNDLFPNIEMQEGSNDQFLLAIEN